MNNRLFLFILPLTIEPLSFKGPPVSKLTLVFFGKVIREYEIDRTLVIGRDQNVEISIDNLGISRRHAQVEKSGTDFTITDLNSNNGVFVNGKKTEKHTLRNGDEITLGKYCLLFKDEPLSENTKKAVDPNMFQATMDIDSDALEKMQKSITGHKKMKLRIVNPNKIKNTYPFSDDQIISIGSSRKRDLYVSGWRAAKMHAVLIKMGKSIRLISISGWKKTLLNGRPIKDAHVKVGDVIKIGKTTLSITMDKEVKVPESFG